MEEAGAVVLVLMIYMVYTALYMVIVFWEYRRVVTAGCWEFRGVWVNKDSSNWAIGHADLESRIFASNQYLESTAAFSSSSLVGDHAYLRGIAKIDQDLGVGAFFEA